MAEYVVEADEAENRLYMELHGHFDEELAAEAADEVIAEIEQLSPGLEIINDLSEFQPMNAEAVQHVQRGKEAAADRGCAATVRVQPDSTTGQMQFERADGDDYPVAMADSRAQAEKLLDERRAEQA
jgi:hypothetical protein